MAVRGRGEFETYSIAERTAVALEVPLRSTVALGFGMEVPILDVDSNRESDVVIPRQVGSWEVRRLRARKVQDRGITLIEHVRFQVNLHGSAVSGIGDKPPVRGRSGVETNEAVPI